MRKCPSDKELGSARAVGWCRGAASTPATAMPTGHGVIGLWDSKMEGNSRKRLLRYELRAGA
jgi:hypothetical protein